MTCQACQTWNSDEEHRCRRCGRRFRLTPTRHVRDQYPIAATALAYQHEAVIDAEAEQQVSAIPAVTAGSEAQPMLFANPNEGRVIPFDQLTTPAEREGIRARAAQLTRPGVKSAKQEVPGRRARRGKEKADPQHRFDFQFGKTENSSQPVSSIPQGAPVAPPMFRCSAALVDSFIVMAGGLVFLSVVRLMTGDLPVGKLAFTGYAIGLAALWLGYKLMWCFANRDSFGVTQAGLRVEDFNGNPPTRRRRFIRAFSSLLSIGAAGLGVVWTLVDAEGLAWHDQISGTFLTILDE